MDKKLITAVAGAGKTTYIVNSLIDAERSLIVTYTDNNYQNLHRKIMTKYNGVMPNNIMLMTYFSFLYNFCYKPCLADEIHAKGITFKEKPGKYLRKSKDEYYLTPNHYLYSNRLALFLKEKKVMDNICNRIERYFDNFIIDEVQDIGGRDFTFLESLMTANVNMLFVGDFYQHTYTTSQDGNVNENLFTNWGKYEKRFTDKGFISDTETLVKSWRCGKDICDFVTEKLGITMGTNKKENSSQIYFVTEPSQKDELLEDPKIIKLHYKDSSKYGPNHKNWGDTKGEDCYEDVCVLLNKKTLQKYRQNKLDTLPMLTKNKLYVAITRAHANCYLIEE